MLVTAVAAYSSGYQDEPTDQQVADRQAAIDKHYEDLYREGLANPAPQYPDATSVTVGPPAPLFEKPEIVDDTEFPNASYAFVNSYRTPFKLHNVVVYAGALRDDPKQGVVVVLDQDTQSWTSTVTEYEPPSANGLLRIVAADGMSVTLADSDGAEYQFDVESGTWK
jgi:hypothetical protein